MVSDVNPSPKGPEASKQASGQAKKSSKNLGINFKFSVSGPVSARERGLGSVRNGRGANIGARGVVSDAQSFSQGALSKQAGRQASKQAAKKVKQELKKNDLFLGFQARVGPARGPGSVRDGRSANIGARGCSRMHNPSPRGPETSKQASRQSSQARTGKRPRECQKRMQHEKMVPRGGLP